MAEYILEERTAVDLIRLLVNNDPSVQGIRDFFTEFCDCDVREYIISGITNQDYFVLQQLRLAMGAPVVFVPHLTRTQRQVQGYLISQVCLNGDLVGTYGTPTAEVTTRILVENDPSCQPPP